MSKLLTGTIECPQCQHSQIVGAYSSINVKLDPELKKQFLEQKLNLFKCEECGLEQPISTDLMYHDMENAFVVYLIPDGDFEAKKAELDAIPNLGEIVDYLKHPLFTDNHQEALILIHLCESNGAPKTDADREKYCQAYTDMKGIYEEAEAKTEHTLPREVFDILDAYSDEAYAWSGEVLRICSPLTGIRLDLVPYALATIVDDLLYSVLDYPKHEWESTLDEVFGNSDEVWDEIYSIRSTIYRTLIAKIGEEQLISSLDAITKTEDPDDPKSTVSIFTTEQSLQLRTFVANGMGY
jgi:translation initiation factor 2 beta subunit (eIF-2beta)/eIF-5